MTTEYGRWSWHPLELPLERGNNELAIAVSESFGGWGLMARML